MTDATDVTRVSTERLSKAQREFENALKEHAETQNENEEERTLAAYLLTRRFEAAFLQLASELPLQEGDWLALVSLAVDMANANRAREGA